MKQYEVEINGVTHTLQLDAKDAERYGKAAKEVKPPRSSGSGNSGGSGSNS